MFSRYFDKNPPVGEKNRMALSTFEFDFEIHSEHGEYWARLNEWKSTRDGPDFNRQFDHFLDRVAEFYRDEELLVDPVGALGDLEAKVRNFDYKGVLEFPEERLKKLFFSAHEIQKKKINLRVKVHDAIRLSIMGSLDKLACTVVARAAGWEREKGTMGQADYNTGHRWASNPDYEEVVGVFFRQFVEAWEKYLSKRYIV
ncbi:MAG: hypothetical protein ACTSU5_02230 [Promethearchaeota archaeon]